MILIALLLAPTVPSLPRPQNLQALVPSLVTSIASPTGKEVLVTSSMMLTVKLFFGSAEAKLSNTATTSAGTRSLEPKP